MMLPRIARVSGSSMAPWAQDGDYVLAAPRAWYRKRALRPGTVVLARHDQLGLLVKRISSVQPDGHLLLAGDHPTSASTQALGRFAPSSVWGLVVAVARSRPAPPLPC